MSQEQPDPHDVPGFSRATGVDDPTPRAEYRDEPPQHEPPTETDALRQAAADELREAAEHVEADNDQEARECIDRAGDLERQARWEGE